jgi:hypothetical protein
MIRSFRAFFLARAQREKILLVALVLIVVGVWLSHFTDRAGQFWHDSHRTRLELAEQAQYLANRQAIMDSAQQSASRFDASRTLNGAGLLAAVQQMAIDAGMSNVRGDLEPDEASGQFAVHTLVFNMPKVDWSSLVSFYVALRARNPYISIEQFSITSPPGSPGHNVSMKLSSVEIERE